MASASFTIYSHMGSSNGHDLVFGGFTGGSNYVSGTGDNVSASNCKVESIVSIYPFPASGLIPVWDNTKQCLRVYAQTNTETNCMALIESQSTSNFASVTFPAVVLGKVDL